MPRDGAGGRLSEQAPKEQANGISGAEVALIGASKVWGRVRALDEVSFAVPAGSFVVLLGPSGCGKTTCLRLIAGLETADSGRVVIAGRDVTARPPAERGVAMVFQSYALFPHLTAAENILFGLKARRVPRAEQARRLTRAAEMLGIEALLQRKPGQLSGGQQQRIALGRAIVAETAVCLMDEPLSNLDAKLRAEMRVEIVALQRRLGITMLYVTHDQTEAMSMADRVILLNEGRIEQDAPPAELYARPDTLFAARFIGTPPMNLLPLEAREGGMVVRGTPGPILVPILAPASGKALLAGLRPEALTLGDSPSFFPSPSGPGSQRASALGTRRGAGVRDLLSSGLALRLGRAEYLGSDTVLHCLCGAEDLPVLIRHPGRIDAAPGAELNASFAPEEVQLFALETGRRETEAPS